MSEPIDDKTFEEYLGRESQLSKRYRALGADEVPAELDGLVLAQARQAVTAKPASPRKKPAWMRWTPPLALAASMVLVISIVIESGTRHELTMPQSAPVREEVAIASDKSAQRESAPLAAEPQQLSALESERSVAAQRRDRVAVELRKSVAPPPAEFMTEAPAATSAAPSAAIAPAMSPPETKIEVPPPAPVAAVSTAANVGNADLRRTEAVAPAESDAVSLDEIAVTSNRAQAARGAGQGAGPRGTVMSPSARGREVSDEALQQRFRESDPQRWLEYIRELRRENKGAEADREWRNFFKAYPDYKVDEKDVARAKQ